MRGLMAPSQRLLVAGVLALASLLGLSGRASAERSHLRIVTTPSISGLPFFVLKELKLVEKQAAAVGLGVVTTEYISLTSGPAVTDALLTDQLDIGGMGASVLIITREKTRGRGGLEIKGMSATNTVPYLLFTARKDVGSIKDFDERDRIAVPAVKVSIHANLLQLAAAKEWGDANWSKLDAVTIGMGLIDAYSLLSTGKSELTGMFSTPPYQYEQLKDPRLKMILHSHDITGGPATQQVMVTSARFRDANPLGYKATMAAMEEAMAFIQANPKESADIYMRNVPSKIPAEYILQSVSDPKMGWSTTPKRIMLFVDFFTKTGAIKTRGDNWKDYFFPEIHDKPGS